jgi:hypothetical protein
LNILVAKTLPLQVILNYAVLELRIKNENNKSFIKYPKIFLAGVKERWDKDGWAIILSGGDPAILKTITFMCVRVLISAGLPFIYTDNKYSTHFRIAQNWNGTGLFET